MNENFGAREGRSDTVTGLLATASCDVTLGYTLAPGKYSVRFGFQSFNASAGGGTKVDQFVSNPIPLTITTDAAPPFTRSANPPLTPMTLPGAGGGGPGATFLVVSATTRPL